MHRWTLLTLAGAAAFLSPAYAADAPSPKGIDAAKLAAMAAAAKGGDEGEKPESPFPEFAEVTKDMKSREGLFTLWSYPEGEEDKDIERLLCQIPSGFLGERFMLSMSVSGGGFFTGFPLSEHVVQWQMHGKQLLLVEPEAGFKIEDDAPVSDVVRRTYPDRILAAVPIVTKAPSGDPVIDLGPWLKSDFADVGWMAGGSGFGMPGRGGNINPELSKWSKRKAFELNVELGVELALASFSPPGSYDKVMVHYSFWKLPKSDYSPRVADERVGYFLTTNQDWSRPTDARDLFNRYINRWGLEKRDPELAQCEPKQPITFYIEKTVPIRFRRAVRDGILEWNKAYEKVGFLNAVEVRQQTDDNEFKDYDPEDMRYSFFRWIVTGAGFAMGPSRANPFTGEIYDADIIFDDSMVRYFEQNAEHMLVSSPSALYRDDPALTAFLDRFPQWRPPTYDWESVSLGKSFKPEVRAEALRRMRSRGCQLCDYSEGMKHQMAFAGAVLAGEPREAIDRLLYDLVKEVVMHEVGHTLGLRHNFQASSIYSIDEIRKKRAAGEATVGSVMDYNPALFFADRTTEGPFITPTIGPYDYWAIEYGYRPFDGSYKSAEAPDVDEAPKGKTDEPAKKKEDGAVAAAKHGTDGAPRDGHPKVGLASDAPAGQKGAESPAPKKPELTGEAAMLHEIASRSTQPELAYSTDEDTTYVSPDPRSNRFDMGADPIEWARTRSELVDKRMANILDWAVKDHESWYHLRSAFISLIVEKAFVLDYVGRYAGGLYVQRSFKGVPGEKPPFKPVEAQRQRAALTLIEEQLFSDKFLSASPDVLNHLASPRWWHEGMDVSFTVDFPMSGLISALQRMQLFDRFFPTTLRRMYDNELRSTEPDKLTVAEYLQRMQKACWTSATDAKRAAGNAWSDVSPLISSTQRSLQREYLNVVEPLVRQSPGAAVSPDIHAMVQQSLRITASGIGEVLKTGKLDFASQAHLEACKSRIERILAPQLDEYSGFGGMTIE